MGEHRIGHRIALYKDASDAPERIMVLVSHEWLRRLFGWPFWLLRAAGSPVFVEYVRAADFRALGEQIAQVTAERDTLAASKGASNDE